MLLILIIDEILTNLDNVFKEVDTRGGNHDEMKPEAFPRLFSGLFFTAFSYS